MSRVYRRDSEVKSPYPSHDISQIGSPPASGFSDLPHVCYPPTHLTSLAINSDMTFVPTQLSQCLPGALSSVVVVILFVTLGSCALFAHDADGSDQADVKWTRVTSLSEALAVNEDAEAVIAIDSDDEALRAIVSRCAHLKRLKAIRSRVTGKGLGVLGLATTITHLNLMSSLGPTDADFRDLLTTLSSLTTLNVSSTKFGDLAAGVHFALANLQALDVSGCPVTDKTLTGLAEHAAQLRALNVSSCSELTEAGLMSITRLKHIESLYATSCPTVSAPFCEALVKLKCLKALALDGGAGLGHKELSAIGSITTLENLDIALKAGVTARELASLSPLTGLEGLMVQLPENAAMDVLVGMAGALEKVTFLRIAGGAYGNSIWKYCKSVQVVCFSGVANVTEPALRQMLLCLKPAIITIRPSPALTVTQAQQLQKEFPRVVFSLRELAVD